MAKNGLISSECTERNPGASLSALLEVLMRITEVGQARENPWRPSVTRGGEEIIQGDILRRQDPVINSLHCPT